MSRLIDADAINPMRCPRSIAEMREWIDELPTAYDIDKVIEEIKARIEFEFDWLRAIKHEEGRITLGAIDVAERAMKSKAIEIVKKGGAE